MNTEALLHTYLEAIMAALVLPPGRRVLPVATFWSRQHGGPQLYMCDGKEQAEAKLVALPAGLEVTVFLPGMLPGSRLLLDYADPQLLPRAQALLEQACRPG